MPVYEYECLGCGERFEELQGIKDKPLKSCKFCGGTIKRLISQSSFALKGGGWYQDGYANKPKDKKKSPPDTASRAKKETPAKAKQGKGTGKGGS